VLKTHAAETNSPDVDRQSPHSHVFWFTWVFTILVLLYPLSTGPAALLCDHDLLPIAPTFRFYRPLEYLADHSPLVERFFEWYLKVWGVEFPKVLN
jgi:hypothetical protein